MIFRYGRGQQWVVLKLLLVLYYFWYYCHLYCCEYNYCTTNFWYNLENYDIFNSQLFSKFDKTLSTRSTH